MSSPLVAQTLASSSYSVAGAVQAELTAAQARNPDIRILAG